MRQRQQNVFNVMAAFDLSAEAGRRKIQGLYRFLSEGRDWNLILLRSAEQLTAERIRQAALQGIDGFLIAIPESDELHTQHKLLKLPTVFVDYPDRTLARDFPGCAFISDNDLALGSAAVRHFRTQGKFKSYGYAAADSTRPWNEARGKSFISGMAAHGMKVHVLTSTDTRPAEEVAAWLSELPRPAGVLAAFDDIARVLMEACRTAKLKVPDDIAVLGIGNDPLICEYTHPPLSSIVPRFEDEGYRAARELHAMMLTGRPPQHREISFGPLRIEERKSTSRTQHGGAIVQRALAFIDEHVLSGATVSDVVQHLNISWRLADLRFKEVTGATIQSALINARLEKVKEMLRDTDMHISDIARRCGCDVTVLRNLFRRHFGISMREFRKGIGEKQSSQSRGRR